MTSTSLGEAGAVVKAHQDFLRQTSGFFATAPREDNGLMQTWLDGASAAIYGASFALRCAGTIPWLIATAEMSGGRSLLDVGAGTGRLAREAADAGFAVTAVDPDETMLSQIDTSGREISLTVGSAPTLPFDDHEFDVVIANFVINHVADPLASLADMYRVVHPHGQVITTVWKLDDALTALLAQIMHSAGVEFVPSGSNDSTRTADGLARLHTMAGAGRTRAGEVTWTMSIDPLALWEGIAAGIATAGKTYIAQSPSERSSIEEAYWARITPDLRQGMLVLPGIAPYCVGTAPPSEA